MAPTSLLVADCNREHEFFVDSVRPNASGRYQINFYHKFLTKQTDLDKKVLRCLTNAHL